MTDRRSTRITVVLGATLLGGSQGGLALLVDRGSLALVIGLTVTTGVAISLYATAATMGALRQAPVGRLGEAPRPWGQHARSALPSASP